MCEIATRHWSWHQLVVIAFVATIGVSFTAQPLAKEIVACDNTSADTEKAQDAFIKSLLSRDPGRYGVGCQAYFVARLSSGKKLSRVQRKGLLMLAIDEQILTAIIQNRYPTAADIRFPGSLGALAKDAAADWMNTEARTYASHARLPVQELENGNSIIVLELPESEINRLSAKVVEIDWVTVRKSVFVDLHSRRDWRTLRRIAHEQAAIIDVLRLTTEGKRRLQKRLVNYPMPNADPIQERIRAIRDSRSWGMIVGPESELDPVMLEGNRLYTSAIELFARLAVVDAIKRRDALKALAKYFGGINGGLSYLAVIQAASDLADSLPKRKEIVAAGAFPILYALRTGGHLFIDEGYADVEPQAFARARDAFGSGAAPSVVRRQLYRAIAQAPRYAPSWAYLGEIMLLEKRYAAAVALLHQAVLLGGGTDDVVRLNLAKAYKGLGKQDLAKAQLSSIWYGDWHAVGATGVNRDKIRAEAYEILSSL